MDVVQCGKHSIVWQNELWINKKITTANISSIFTGAWTNSHWDLIHKWYTVLCLECFYHDIVFVFLQGRWSISSISHQTLHQQRLLTSSSVSHLNQHESVISLNSYFKASRRALQHWHASIKKKSEPEFCTSLKLTVRTWTKTWVGSDEFSFLGFGISASCQVRTANFCGVYNKRRKKQMDIQ